MISMNMSPPRLRAARKLARTPLVKARILNSCSRNIGWATLVSMMQKATSRPDPDHQGAEDRRAGPAHDVMAVGLDAVGDAHHDQDEAEGEGDVAGPVDAGRPPGAGLVEFEVAEDGGEQPDGHGHQEDQPPVDRGQQTTEDQSDERAAEGGGLVDPSAMPRWLSGKTSVRMADELAMSMAAPTPWRMRMVISHTPAAWPVIQVMLNISEKTVKTAKPRL